MAKERLIGNCFKLFNLYYKMAPVTKHNMVAATLTDASEEKFKNVVDGLKEAQINSKKYKSTYDQLIDCIILMRVYNADDPSLNEQTLTGLVKMMSDDYKFPPE